MHARYYASASGRFCTSDANLGSASDPLTLNRYLYCSSDPVNFADPDGRASMDVRLSKGKPLAYDFSAQSGRAQMSEYQRDFVQKEYGARLSKDPLIVRVRTAVNEVLFTAKRSAYLSQKYGSATAALWRASVAQRYQKQLADYYCGTASYLANGSYDRDKALQYAYEYSHISLKDGDLEYFYSLVDLLFRNPLYPTYGGNCANFVSQVLHEGGFPMNTDWHSRPSMAGIIAFVAMGISAQEALRFLSGKTFDATRKWTLAAEQFEYFSNPNNGFTSRPIIDVHKTEVLSGKGEMNVSLSDIRSQAVSLGIQKGDLMYFYDEKGVHHATVISEVTSDGIKYSANTANRYNYDLEDGLKNDYGVLIIRVNDEIQK